MNPLPSYCCSPPSRGKLLVSPSSVGWIQRGEAGIINRKVQLKQPGCSPHGAPPPRACGGYSHAPPPAHTSKCRHTLSLLYPPVAVWKLHTYLHSRGAARNISAEPVAPSAQKEVCAQPKHEPFRNHVHCPPSHCDSVKDIEIDWLLTLGYKNEEPSS